MPRNEARNINVFFGLPFLVFPALGTHAKDSISGLVAGKRETCPM